jgi:hypothetical protein
MRRALIVTGLSIVLMGASAGGASAATITPTSADFGRILIGHSSPPRTFTVTKGSESKYYPTEGVGGGFVINNGDIGVGGGHPAGFYQAATTCAGVVLTSTNPSCTITAVFQPNLPGPNPAVVFADDYSPDPIAQLTGIGLIPRGSFFCRTHNGHPVHKKLWKYCLKKKK